MPGWDEVFEQIDLLAREEPDPAWTSADIKETLESLVAEGLPWPRILENYSATEVPAIGIAIAACLAKDAAREEPRTSLSQLLYLRSSLDWQHPSLAHMVLVATENRARHHPEEIQIEDSMETLRRFLLEDGGYSGDGEFLVRISWLATLESLRDAGLWDAVLDPSTRKDVRSHLLRLQQQMDGPFQEQVDDLLESLD